MKFILKHKILIVLIILIVAVIFIGQNLLNSDSSPQTSAADSQIVNARKANIISMVSASGQILSGNYLPITTSVNGIVKKVYVKEGDSVKKGQKIMDVILDSEGELSNANAYSNYLKAKSSLASGQNSLLALESDLLQKEEAFETEKEQNSYQSHDERVSYKLAENAYNSAKATYDIKKSDLAQLQIALSSAWSEYQSESPTITASSDGIIANIVAVEGTKIENSVTSDRSVQTVASIKITGTPILNLNITELDINKIKVGQKVNIVLNSLSKETFTGVVAGIDKIGSESSGVSNYPVIIKFDSESDLILPNMGADADVIVEQKENVLTVPNSAITSKNSKKYVTIVNNGQENQVEVTTGVSDETNTEILTGLSENDRVKVTSLPTTGFTSTTSSTNRGGSFIPFIGGR